MLALDSRTAAFQPLHPTPVMPRALLGLAPLLLLAAASRTAMAQGPACRPLDADAEDHRTVVVQIDTGSAAAPRQLRERLELTPVPVDSLTWVTDEGVCQR